MKKLELKHLAPYLPYKLNIFSKYANNENGVIWELKFENSLNVLTHDSRKPILRPLSDLTKEIEVDGEKFIPLEIIFNMIDDVNYVDYKGDLINPKFQIDDGWNHCIYFNGENDSELCLSYGEKAFILMLDDEVELLQNQLELYNKLFELHFDVFELIENGLAIDINTL